tara:strand:- start:942 stop:1793 length:852 start_codon:yes stop_codon:yes gene_type:complete
MLTKKCEFWKYSENIDNLISINFFFKILQSIINFPFNFYTYLCLNYHLYNINLSKLDEIEEQNLSITNGKVISWNIQYGNGCLFNSFTFPKMINFLKNESAEIYLFQEVLEMEKYKQTTILKNKLNMHYSLYSPISNFNNMKIGNYILCKNEIKKLYDDYKFQIVETLVNNENIILVNTHLTADLTCMTQEKEIKNLINILSNYKDRKILILGDFNLPYWSSVIKILKNNNLKELSNQLYSFPSIYPLFKFDYCFYKNFENLIINIPYKVKFSDHLPVIINLQ